ncbi:MAG: hypothetical protein WCS18_05275 [Sphaerochaetaceae bacterium]
MILYLDKWEFQLAEGNEEMPRDLDVRKYPYLSGGEITDMGAGPGVHHYRVLVNGAQYDSELDAIRDWFRSRFSDPVDLYDPIIGQSLQGFPGNSSFEYPQRNPRTVWISFDFQESGIREADQAPLDVESAADEAVTAIVADRQVSVADAMASAGVPDAEGDDWTLLDKWASMGSAARAFATAAQTAVGTLNGYISQAAAPIDAISSTLEFASTLSGTVVAAVQNAIESCVTLARDLAAQTDLSSDSQGILASLIQSAKDLRTALAGAPDSIRTAYMAQSAGTIAREAAARIAADETTYSEAVAAESEPVDDLEGNRIGAAETDDVDLMTPAQLESCLAMAREYIQLAIDDGVDGDSAAALRRQARDLAEKVRRVRLEYMRTRTVQVDDPTPLHKILLDQGISYRAACRVAALNDVKNPTFMQGEVLVYAG